MARPSRKEKPSRIKVQVRFTPAELAELDELCHGHGLYRSEFIRRRALGGRITTPPGMVELSAELGRIGNLLNHMTRLWHIAKNAGQLRITEARADKLEQQLDEVWDAVQRVQMRLWSDQHDEDDPAPGEAAEVADADR